MVGVEIFKEENWLTIKTMENEDLLSEGLNKEDQAL